jgi:DNA-binding LacI/PurR family transcriptional regulator
VVHTASTRETRGRRGSEKFLGLLRARIRGGGIQSGAYLPTVRQLSAEHGISCKTIHKAMQVLVREGLIAAEPRQGYRVRQGAGAPELGCPVALLMSPDNIDGWPTPFRAELLVTLRAAAERRDWSVLAPVGDSMLAGQLRGVLESGRAFGAITDLDDSAFLDELRCSEIPAVVVNAFATGHGLDSVVQDGQGGALLAAQHLASLGCRRVAYFGSVQNDAHAIDRFAGAAAGLQLAGMALARDLIVNTGLDRRDADAHRLLSRKNRPDGIISPWRGFTLSLKKAADELGLELGKDVHVIGWCPEEIYETDYARHFGGAPVPPTVTWSVREMAETALARLSERRSRPDLPPVCIKVGAKLKVRP